MLDPAALHPGRSLQETLKLNAILLDLPPSAVAEGLSLAGLETVRKKRVGYVLPLGIGWWITEKSEA